MTWIRGQLGPSLLVVIIVFVSGPGAAQSRLSIGLISPSSRETARPYVDPFNRLVESRRLGRLEVESAELQNAESVVNATRRLVVKQVDLLVLPANATVTLAVLKMG